MVSRSRSVHCKCPCCRTALRGTLVCRSRTHPRRSRNGTARDRSTGRRSPLGLHTDRSCRTARRGTSRRRSRTRPRRSRNGTAQDPSMASRCRPAGGIRRCCRTPRPGMTERHSRSRRHKCPIRTAGPCHTAHRSDREPRTCPRDPGCCRTRPPDRTASRSSGHPRNCLTGTAFHRCTLSRGCRWESSLGFRSPGALA